MRIILALILGLFLLGSVKADCNCSETGVCFCGPCQCGLVSFTEKSQAEIYEDMQALAIETNRPMVVGIGVSPPSGFLGCRYDAVWGKSQDALYVCVPRNGELHGVPLSPKATATDCKAAVDRLKASWAPVVYAPVRTCST